MKQLLLIIILSKLALYSVHAQTRSLNKMILPANAGINLQKNVLESSNKNMIKTFCIETPALTSLIHFNDRPVLRFSKKTCKPVMIFTEFSFADVLENSMNGLKESLVNTYDSHIPELFNDAPSLFKIRYIIVL